jgi:hypothetical protein
MLEIRSGLLVCGSPSSAHVRPLFIPDFFVTCNLGLLEWRFAEAGLARASAIMLSAFHNILMFFGLALAGALTAAWDGLLGYGLFKLMSTVF